MDRNYVIVVELSSRKIKVLTGFKQDNKVYVLHYVEKYISNYISNGRVVDQVCLAKEIKEMSVIKDPKAKINVQLSSVYLILPPIGFEAFESDQFTNAVSEVYRISNVDVINVISMTKNTTLPRPDIRIVDIVPLDYQIDGDRHYAKPPIDELSKQLILKAQVHALPIDVLDGYLDSMKLANVEVIHTFMAPYASSDLINSYPDTPDNYFLVDIGSDITSVTVVFNRKLLCTRTLNIGGNNITDRIAKEFNISIFDAEKYKALYGIDDKVMKFDIPFCESVDNDGNITKRYVNELVNVIKDEVNSFIKSLNALIEQTIIHYNGSSALKRFPMYLIGGGSLLNGLVKYMEPKIESETLKVLIPDSLGARDPSCYNLLGAIYISDKWPSAIEDNSPRLDQVHRNPYKGGE